MPRPILPILGVGPPEPPPYGGLGLEGWARGATFLEFVEASGEHRAEIEAAFAGVEVAPPLLGFFAAYPRRVRVLALGSAASLDARYNLAQAERLFCMGSNLWMRIFDPESNADLVRRFAAGEEMPRLVFFGDDRREFARWGPRPRRLRARGEALRAAYLESRGGDLAEELRALLEMHAGAAP